MAIKLYTDRIEIGNYTLFEGNNGLQFTGRAAADKFTGASGLFQGTTAGYIGAATAIDRMAFASDSVVTSVGTVPGGFYSYFSSSMQSKIAGYGANGQGSNNQIFKFPFATSTTVAFVTNSQRLASRSKGSSNREFGFSHGGAEPTGVSNRNEKIPFANEASSTFVGTLTVARRDGAALSSAVSGYRSGGYGAAGNYNTIDKFPFASSSNATDVGDLTATVYEANGVSGPTHGYTMHSGTRLDKNSFASDGNSTNVTTSFPYSTRNSHGLSSSTTGYIMGGAYPFVRTGVKFPFASDTSYATTGTLSIDYYGQMNCNE